MLLFGGPHGAHLSKPIEISVWVGRDGHILGVYFTYSVEVDGHKVHTLGRRWPLGRDEGSRVPCDCFTTGDCLIDDYCPGDKRFDFPIDGPQGEVINRVDVETMSDGEFLRFRVRLLPKPRYPSYSMLTEMTQIHTSFNRTATFPQEFIYCGQDDYLILPVETAKSTTITGFYAILVCYCYPCKASITYDEYILMIIMEYIV